MMIRGGEEDGAASSVDRKSVRFELDLDSEGIEKPQLLSHVQERFVGYFELPERCVPFEVARTPDNTNGEGFPEILDLSQENPSTNVEKKQSLFAMRLEGRKNERQTQRDKKCCSLSTNGAAEVSENIERLGQNGVAEESIRNLEVMDGANAGSRYALDPVHFDFATKCLRNVCARREQQVVRLFGSLASSPPTAAGENEKRRTILSMARSNMDSIRSLYLEQIKSEESGRCSWRFARKFVDPLSDGAWTLNPIRRVLDAVSQRNSQLATSDDVDIVRLALQWTVLVASERPAFFRASINIGEFYCRLSELFLMGPEVSQDEGVSACLSVLVEEFLLDAARKGLLELQLHQRIASLDAFMPFYADLLKHFEEFSAGDPNFALLLLLGAYMNASELDGQLMALEIWSPLRDVVRQMTLPRERVSQLLDFISESDHRWGVDADLHSERAKLLMSCAAALRDGRVTEQRNPALFAVATGQLGGYLGEHERDGDGLARAIREMLVGKATFPE